MGTRFTFTAPLWEADVAASWVFVTVPPEIADEIEERQGTRTAFGSVKVEVTVGGTSWRTSLFPDVRVGSYVLPVKRSVRNAESLTIGDDAVFSLSVVAA